ncbi:MAG TPA: MarR family transcriptional regulator [Acidobacteriaceae bacterium]|nr:MarR family transcriptional regulator [Acidobacteriaceae bacterium]
MISRGDREIIQDLAWFRYNLRRFLRFSEKAARACGVTPQQHQLMLGIAGFTSEATVTISELAEFLQERNNSVVGLVERAVESGLVRRASSPKDRRQVVVSLTPRGEEILARLSALHHQEVERVRTGILSRRKIGQRLTARATNGHAHGKGAA